MPSSRPKIALTLVLLVSGSGLAGAADKPTPTPTPTPLPKGERTLSEVAGEIKLNKEAATLIAEYAEVKNYTVEGDVDALLGGEFD